MIKVMAVPEGSIDVCTACFVNRASVVIQLGRVDPYGNYTGGSCMYKLCERCSHALIENLQKGKEAAHANPK